MGLVSKDFRGLPDFKEVDIFAMMRPALEVGGDLYDYFPLDKDRICFVIGDVSDKGIPAALFMAMTRTAFKISAVASPELISLTMQSQRVSLREQQVADVCHGSRGHPRPANRTR